MSVFSKNRLAVFLGVLLGAIPAYSAPLDRPEQETLQDFSISPNTFAPKNIRVTGNVRIETQTILDRVPLRGDLVYSAEDMDSIVRTLVATGFFKYVSVKMSGGVLIITVSENPSISKIAFEGNESATDEDLKKIIPLKTRQVLSMIDVREAEKIIREFYKIKGLYGVSVMTQAIKQDSNRILLIFKIKEGKKAAISKILFKGNRQISSGNLYTAISSREKRWYYFFGDAEAIYSAEKLQQDEVALRDFYRNQGYMDACVSDAYAELSPNQRDFILTFNIKEGARYTFGSTTITSKNPKEVPPNLLKKDFSWKKGDWFDMMIVEGKAKQMTSALNHKGLSFFEVVAETKTCGKSINVQFVIRPIPPVYVGNITIQGNNKTNDEVIRRELLFKEGDPLTAGALKFSEMRVKRLGFFDALEIVSSSNEAQDKQDLTVRVKEKKSTSEVGLSGGYDSSNKFIARINFLEKNFMGQGQSVSMSGLLSNRMQAVNLNINAPYFMGSRVTVGSDVGFSRQKGYTKKNFDKDGGYAETSYGAGVMASYGLRKGLVQSWSYRPSVQTLKFLSKRQAKYLKDNIADHDTRYLSTLGHQLAYNRAFFKGSSVKSGYLLSTGNRFTGLGGTVRYMSNAVDGVVFYNFDVQGDYKLRLSGNYQLMTKLGYVRFMDQFFLGGFAFPGFQDSGIGPRDKRTKDALGGRQSYVISAKFDFPIPSMKEFQIRGCLHAHMGSLWNTIFEEEVGYPINSLDFNNRASIGFGLFTALPMVGKIGIIFSRATLKNSCDQTNSFEIVLGRDF